MQNTKTLGDGENTLELTVVKFQPLKGYEMLGKLQELGEKARTDLPFMKAMLANSSVIRVVDGQPANISLGQGDAAFNRAFSGVGLALIVEALGFAMDVNFADFFAAAQVKLDQRAANRTE